MAMLAYPSPALIVLVGLPGIGKTSFIERATIEGTAVHLDLDRFFAEFGFTGFAVEVMFNRTEAALSAGQAVIFDTTGLREYIRQDCLQLAGRCGCSCHLLVFDGDGATAAARRKLREREDLPADSARGYERLWQEFQAQLDAAEIDGFASITRLDPREQNGVTALRFLTS